MSFAQKFFAASWVCSLVIVGLFTYELHAGRIAFVAYAERGEKVFTIVEKAGRDFDTVRDNSTTLVTQSAEALAQVHALKEEYKQWESDFEDMRAVTKDVKRILQSSALNFFFPREE